MRIFYSVLVTFLFVSGAAFAQDISFEEAEQRAQKAHDVASSDMIYQQEEWKALYYQNIQIIQLLQEIRDSLRIQNERAARADQKP